MTTPSPDDIKKLAERYAYDVPFDKKDQRHLKIDSMLGRSGKAFKEIPPANDQKSYLYRCESESEVVELYVSYGHNMYCALLYDRSGRNISFRRFVARDSLESAGISPSAMDEMGFAYLDEPQLRFDLGKAAIDAGNISSSVVGVFFSG